MAKRKYKRKRTRQTGTSNKAMDLRFVAKVPGKRPSPSGGYYYEWRANRSDKNPEKRL